MQTFLQAFDQKFRLGCLIGIKAPDIVGRADLSIRAWPDDRQNVLDDLLGPNARKAQRIVARRVVIRARDLVRPGRQLELRFYIEDAETGIGRCAILSENLDTEELV